MHFSLSTSYTTRSPRMEPSSINQLTPNRFEDHLKFALSKLSPKDILTSKVVYSSICLSFNLTDSSQELHACFEFFFLTSKSSSVFSHEHFSKPGLENNVRRMTARSKARLVGGMERESFSLSSESSRASACGKNSRYIIHFCIPLGREN